MSMQTLKRSAEKVSSDSRPDNNDVQFAMKPLALPKIDSLEGRSLASIMSLRRSGLRALHMQFASQMSQRREVSFQASQKATDEPAEPPLKRRKFQRRNSKTAAMLFSSMSSIVADLEPVIEDQQPRNDGPSDAWDSGLEIAEDLVRQLKLRRQNIGRKAV